MKAKLRDLPICVTTDQQPSLSLFFQTCGNIFNRYFCGGKRFDYADSAFESYIANFDAVFWEVNTGRPSDLMPWAIYLELGHIERAKASARTVRNFVDTELIEPLLVSAEGKRSKATATFFDALIPFLTETEAEKARMGRDKALYCL